jgi:Cu(I)/Ag(I) efflux system membrane protein CusA/SilA
MITRVIELSIRWRLFVVLAVAGVSVWGIYCFHRMPVDAIPDLSENQIIVWTDWHGRDPNAVEDQVTYPLSVSLQGLLGVKSVRALSEFGFSMVTLVFEDDVDLYFARQRVAEKLSAAAAQLPAGVTPYLATDATALGQVFWYTVEGEGRTLDELRAIQDWYVRQQLHVPGVAEVASIGGFVREYQVDVDPQKLRAFDVSLGNVFEAVMRSNTSFGGRVMQSAGSEFLISAVGWLRGVDDLRDVVVAERNGIPITIEQIGSVQLGPAFRRGLLEKNGSEAVGGVVAMRHGEDPLSVIQRVKARIQSLKDGLPDGVRIVPFYDRTGLISASITTLTRTLLEEIAIASLVVLFVLRHFRSALLICSVLPLSVLISFIFMYYLDIPSNIMSLSGILISIGVLVDAGIVMTENAYNRLEERAAGGRVTGDTRAAVLEACRVVGGPLFFSIVIMLLSFAPLFFLEGREGKMFTPLASTKTFALIAVGVLAVTYVPALLPILVRGRLKAQGDIRLVRSIARVYENVLRILFRHPDVIVLITGLLLVASLPMFPRKMPWILFVVGTPFILGFSVLLLARRKVVCFSILLAAAFSSFQIITPPGEEFMPPLDELSLLDMPVTRPGVSITQGSNDIRKRNAVLKGFPEAHQVVGKLGRADTPADPAPLEMVETIMTLLPKEWWPRRKVGFGDVLGEAEAASRALLHAGILSPMGDPEREAFVHAVAQGATARIDRLLRAMCAERLEGCVAARSRALAGALRGRVVSFLLEKGALKEDLPGSRWLPFDDELAREYGPRLDEWILLEDVTGAAHEVAGFLEEAGALEARSSLWVKEGGLFTAVSNLASVVTGRRESTFFEDLREALEDERHRLAVADVKRLDWELVDRAPRAMVENVIAETIASARAARRLAREPRDDEIQALEAEQERRVGTSLLLWRKQKSDLVKELDADLQVPGWTNIWTQPIINRIDMLSTGVRTEIGVKVFGRSIEDLQAASRSIVAILQRIPGAADVTASQIAGRNHLEVSVDRKKAARFGLNVEDVHAAIELAFGARHATMTVEGRERFPVSVSYHRDHLADEEKLESILVTARHDSMSPGGSGGPMRHGAEEEEAVGVADADGHGGETRPAPRPAATGDPGGKAAFATPLPGGVTARAEAGRRLLQVPLSLLADARIVTGPAMIQSENGLLCSFVSLNVRGRDMVGFVEEARTTLEDQAELPPGCHIEWSGQFEHQMRAERTLTLVLPLVLCIIAAILYLTYRDVPDTLMMFLAVPGAVAGGAIFQYLLPRLGVDVSGNFSVAVWVGYIACFGLATATSIVMLVYLREAIAKRGGIEGIRSEEEIKAAVIDGAVHRLRPKLLTEATTLLALTPMLWATGVGAEYMRPIAAPILGGILVADEVIDLFIPVVFYWDRRRRFQKRLARGVGPPAPGAPRTAQGESP